MALTPQGLTIPRLPEILSSIEARERANIDPNISTTSDTLIGQFNNIFGTDISDVYELAQAVYDAFNIDKAEGKNLDDLATLRGVTRFPATRSTTDRQQFIADNGTVVVQGSLFRNPITDDQFFNPSEISINNNACLSAELTVEQVLNLTEYTITVNGINYSYTSSGAATASEIVDAFEADINASGSDWSASVAGEVLTISSDTTAPIQIIVITYISVGIVTVEGTVSAVEFGPIVAPINSVTEAVTIIPGLISTTNLLQLTLGREEESDEDLRQRVKTAGQSDCTGTIPSIQKALLNNIVGVTSAEILENTLAQHIFNIDNVTGSFILGEDVVGGTSTAVGKVVELIDSSTIKVNICGLLFQQGEVITGNTSGATADLEKDIPPHSYETIVVGGDNTEVAEEIWRTKPVSIQLRGNTNVLIQDSNGKNRSIDFTRPTALNLAIRIQYTRYDEESFPLGGNDEIRDIALNHTNGLGIDTDVITGRYYGPIYSNVSGIDELIVEIQEIASPGDPPNPGNWQEATIPVDIDEFANTTETDITVSDITP